LGRLPMFTFMFGRFGIEGSLNAGLSGECRGLAAESPLCARPCLEIARDKERYQLCRDGANQQPKPPTAALTLEGRASRGSPAVLPCACP
jgi:hypothetical protein